MQLVTTDAMQFTAQMHAEPNAGTQNMLQTLPAAIAERPQVLASIINKHVAASSS